MSKKSQAEVPAEVSAPAPVATEAVAAADELLTFDALLAGAEPYAAAVCRSYWGWAGNQQFSRATFDAQLAEAMAAPANKPTPGELRRLAAIQQRADALAARGAR